MNMIWCILAGNFDFHLSSIIQVYTVDHYILSTNSLTTTPLLLTLHPLF